MPKKILLLLLSKKSLSFHYFLTLICKKNVDEEFIWSQSEEQKTCDKNSPRLSRLLVCKKVEAGEKNVTGTLRIIKPLESL